MPREASILVIVLIALLIALGVYFALAANAQSQTPCFEVAERDRVIALSEQAIDSAFTEQVKALFAIWVRDPGDQPRRAMTGMSTNLSAYHRARANIRQWTPEICK